MAIKLSDKDIKARIWSLISLSKEVNVPSEVKFLLRDLIKSNPDNQNYKKDLLLCEGTLANFLENCHLYEYRQ